MKYRSVFDIIGPVMVGPSSSHTAGAVRIGLFTRYIFGMQPEDVKITLYGSFKETYKGHGTDIALIGGLLGYNTSDKRIRTSMEDAKAAGMEFEFIESGIEHIHPNTAKIEVQAGRHSLDLIGKSIGGGKMVIFELLGFDVNLSGDFPTYFIFYKFNDKNKEELSLKIVELFGDKKVSEKYSSSILEGTNLLVVESLEKLNKESIQKITELGFVNEVKFADKL
ncbi:L-serine ammonia-lyase, iron-sulfur-dependent subunit beta [Gemella haemolysans]|jgi:L-serine dehydratase, iron-sulfur-dependent, beta subunit|uniref:L-serine deaminase n=2 Tax=Gemella haemolysans TaxID=1379 RepID=A0AA87APP8_9BACL|nr:L-serine ammonia-lyase, iron-sulfur-dependent subunit beta [Gemella haemolysans]EGF86535.1 L-serine dehydratase [Gemella haemolysans M341]QIX87714.1 L-serine ammonia-lyase, iron-sulfur-dependent, subunit beta [Gemella haemolysans]